MTDFPAFRANNRGDVLKKSKSAAAAGGTQAMLKHWQEAVPNDRLAHLVKDVTRAYVRALQTRLAKHSVSFGHWAFLAIGPFCASCGSETA
jgi:hypothetical protein